MDRRWWVVLVGVASLGMPRPSWSVLAQLPVNDDPGRARIVEVEASHAPRLEVRDATSRYQLGDREAPWAGKGTFFVPAGVHLDAVRVVGYCSGGACCRCERPEGSFVRVIGLRPVFAWRIERDATDHVETGPKKLASSHVTVRAAGGFPRLTIEGDVQPSSVQAFAGGFNVLWPNRDAPFAWRARIVIEGACEREPCEPPPDAALEIVNVKTEVR